MAGVLFSVKPVVMTIVSASGPITLVQIIAPTNQRVIVEELVFSFNGVTAADPTADQTRRGLNAHAGDQRIKLRDRRRHLVWFQVEGGETCVRGVCLVQLLY